jgi:hypothetical protein
VDCAFAGELEMKQEGKIFFKAIVSMVHSPDMKITALDGKTRPQFNIGIFATDTFD